MRPFSHIISLLFLAFAPFTVFGQQQVDNDFTPAIPTPLFASGKGPVILVDGGHNNFHTLNDKFAPFGKIAERDGFRIRSLDGSIENTSLKEARILVIANALHERNLNSWRQPVYSAFTPEEINHIIHWVKNGGRLFLIADHMPFPGAVSGLAEAFGFSLYDGFALRGSRPRFDIFSFSNGMLRRSDLTGSIDSVVSFTGQAFRIPDSAISIVTLDSNYSVLMPDVAWEFSAETKKMPAEGLSQLAYVKFGSGKVVMAGEAAMFTAQRVGETKIGLNAHFARSNVPLLLQLLDWLSN